LTSETNKFTLFSNYQVNPKVPGGQFETKEHSILTVLLYIYLGFRSKGKSSI